MYVCDLGQNLPLRRSPKIPRGIKRICRRYQSTDATKWNFRDWHCLTLSRSGSRCHLSEEKYGINNKEHASKSTVSTSGDEKWLPVFEHIRVDSHLISLSFCDAFYLPSEYSDYTCSSSNQLRFISVLTVSRLGYKTKLHHKLPKSYLRIIKYFIFWVKKGNLMLQTTIHITSYRFLHQ